MSLSEILVSNCIIVHDNNSLMINLRHHFYVGLYK